MSHANARTTFHGRLLIVQRHRAGMAAGSHRQGDGDLPQVRADVDQPLRRRGRGRSAATASSRPHSMPRRTSDEIEVSRSLVARRQHRRGPDWIGAELGRAGPDGVPGPAPPPAWPTAVPSCDPMTGEVIRALEGHRGPLRTRPTRRAGAHGRQEARPDPRRRRLAGPRPRAPAQSSPTRDKADRIGFDYVHSLVDDHSRFAYSEILPDEKAATCAAFLDAGRSSYFAGHGIPIIERLMTDNAMDLQVPRPAPRSVPCSSIEPDLHQAALPLAERQGRTVQPHPASRVGLPAASHVSNHERTAALATLDSSTISRGAGYSEVQRGRPRHLRVVLLTHPNLGHRHPKSDLVTVFKDHVGHLGVENCSITNDHDFRLAQVL